MVKVKDVLRKFIEAQLPGLRKTSLKKEVGILGEFVERRKQNPQSVMYSRNFVKKVKNAGYHLKNLSEAGALESSFIEPVKVVVDLAEETGTRTKRGSKQIRKVRELRVTKILEHASRESTVLTAVTNALNVSSIEQAESKITYTDNFSEERNRFRNYNKAVEAVKKLGVTPIEYDYLIWRNAAKPRKLTDDFVYYLRDNGFNVEV